MMKSKVALFIPCFIDQIKPEIGFSVLKVLQKVGCEVTYNEQQTCCGQPAFNAGYKLHACNVAEKWIKDYESIADDDTYIVSPSASCVGMIRNQYEDLIDDQALIETYYKLQKKTYEFTEFLVDVLEIDQITDAHFPVKATYHDSCSALRECGISEAPRQLLQHVKGLEMLDLPHNTTCCGFGGTFSVKFHEISSAMAAQKTYWVEDIGATHVISTDYSCLMHLEAFSDKKSKFLKYVHIADVLASGW